MVNFVTECKCSHVFTIIKFIYSIYMYENTYPIMQEAKKFNDGELEDLKNQKGPLRYVYIN